MADGKVLLEVVVEGKNVKVVQRQVEGVTDAVNQNTTAQRKNAKAVQQNADVHDHFNRGLKGVGQSTLSSGKALSKMRDIVGSSGLVGAYATLAANLFAATAAFNAFKKAAETEQLSKSIQFLGATSGINLQRISKNLVEVTGNAISMKEAMAGASFGTSAGFSGAQLTTLAKVAKGASAALGRDLGDSYDRLIRGAAKLEPEILDELGIIVRIDKASADYAARVGKTTKELSLWEKQQAFVNAINEQGIKKYGELADAIETNPYDKLLAALTNASNATIKWLNDTLHLPEFLNYLSENTIALSGAVGIFASSISKQMLPILYQIPMAMAAFADTAVDKSLASLSNTFTDLGKLGDKGAGAIQKFNYSLAAGTLTAEQLIDVNSELAASQKGLEIARTRTTNAINKTTEALLKETQAEVINQEQVDRLKLKLESLQVSLAETNAKIDTTSIALNRGTIALDKMSNAAQRNKISMGVAQLGNLQFASGLKNVILGTIGAIKGLERTAGAFGAFSFYARAAGIVLGTAFSTVLSVILALSLALSVLAMLFPKVSDKISKWWNSITGGKEEAESAMDSVIKKTDELSNHLNNVNKTIDINAKSTGIDNVVVSVVRLSNVLNEVGDVVSQTFQDVTEANKKFIDDLGRADLRIQQYKNNREIERLKEELAAKGISSEVAATTKVQTTETRMAGRTGAVTIARDLSETEQLILDYQKASSLVDSLQTQINNFSIDELARNISDLPIQLGDRLNESKSILTGGNFFKDIEKNAPELAKKLEKDFDISVSAVDKKILDFKNRYSTMPREVLAITAPQIRAEMLGLQGEVDALFSQARAAPAEFAGKIKDMPDAINTIAKELDVVGGKSENKFSKLLEIVNNYTSGITTASGATDELNAALKEYGVKQLSEALGGKVDQSKLFASIRKGAKAAAEIPGLEQSVQNLDTLQKLLPTNSNILEISLKKQNELTKARITSEEASLEILKARGGSTQDIEAAEQRLNELRMSDLVALGTKLKKEEEINQKIRERTKTIIEINSLEMENAKLAKEISKFYSTGRTELNLQDQIDFIEQEKASKISIANLEYEVLVAKLNTEKKISEATVQRLAMESKATAEKAKAASLANPKDINLKNAAAAAEANAIAWASVEQEVKSTNKLEMDLQDKLHKAKIKNIELEAEKQIIEILKGQSKINEPTTATILPKAGEIFDPTKLTEDTANAISASITMGIKGAETTLQKLASKGITEGARVDSLKKVIELEKQISEVRQERATASPEQIPALDEKLKALQDAQNKAALNDPFIKFRAGIAAAKTELAPFIESLKSLGPQGELVAAIASGGLAIADSFTTLADKAASASDKLAAIGSIVNSVASIVSMASSAKIAGIDAEINAEKQRDGKSKESLAKIEALEKRKESSKRKAFEANKKMMMATTIINTAAAAMAAWAPPPMGAGPLFGGALTAMIVAMGAAQLAIIAGMQYEGGGSSVGTATPQTVSVGQRRNTVDLAKSQSASGELSYMQGDKGIGGPENFRPAFIGSRAAGGRVNAGYMVGEQGPELFVPKVPGRIVPSDKINNTPPQNVNISISALDAAGVEEVLVKQRGHIIGMIREAANSYGEKFLESVDTRVYTQPSKGYNGVARA